MKIDSKTAEACRLEYIAGFVSIPDLAGKYGVPLSALKWRAMRYRWADQRAEYKDAQRNKPQLLRESHELGLKDMAREFLESLASDVCDTLRQVKAKPLPEDWPGLNERETVLSSIQRRGRTAFGLDTQSATAQVLISLQSGLGQLPGRSADVIDVESVPTKVADAQQ